MYNYNASNPTVTYCTFSGNSADDSGGGMYNYLGSNPILVNCAFSGNSAIGSGGAMYNFSSSSPTLTNCRFSGNFADAGGAVYIRRESGSAFTHCTFSGNSAAFGSSIACDSDESWDPSAVEILNTILFSGQDEVWNNDGSTIIITYSCIQGGWSGTGNIDDDPLFVATGYWHDNGTPEDPDDDVWFDGNYRFLSGSPCIDTGDPDFVREPGETDLDGHTRVLCDRVDMGAYEFGIGDHDCNQAVDLFDFAAWDACFAGPQDGLYDPQCEAFDFESDGDVDLADFAGFQNVFTGG